jgi:hypothetical protein
MTERDMLLGVLPDGADPADVAFYHARIRRVQVLAMRRLRRSLPAFMSSGNRAARAARRARKQRRGWA